MILIIPFEIATLYFQKHPEEWEQMKEDYDKHVMPVHRIMSKAIKSGFDDRWDRSLVEWELKRLEQKYNVMLRDDLIESWENNGQNQNKNQNQSRNQENKHCYTYFECRHPDNTLYEKQKGKRKSNPDGWKYCCTLKPSQFAKIKLNERTTIFVSMCPKILFLDY
jgi:hypothetical protein